jgi:phosphopantetheine--protein transferase-like protein
MNQQDTLCGIVASFLGLEPAQITDEVSLTGSRLQGSLARTRLYAAIRHKLGVECRAAYSAKTYAQLSAAVFGAPKPTVHGTSSMMTNPEPNGHLASAHGLELERHLACGIDIEMVAELPVVQDHWTDPFYSATFTPAEIAYCLMQPNPTMHFTARWCAKEALKKCDAAYHQIDPRHIEVALESTGAPFLCRSVDGVLERIPVAISLSHTPHMAAAMVVKLTARNGEYAVTSVPMNRSFAGPEPRELAEASSATILSSGQRLLVTFLIGGAWAVALWALART